MHIAILTFDGFNELDSLIAYGMLSRISLLGDPDWKVSIASPTEKVTSMNGLSIDAHIDIKQASDADAIVIGSGMKTREVANNASILDQLKLNPSKQLIAAQCSGTFLLAKLGLLGQMPACTDTTSKLGCRPLGSTYLTRLFIPVATWQPPVAACRLNTYLHG